ncbi:MAG: GNAT family N-acetyltransferase [Kofleriaceae bacterium]|nr:GNAT family N-acetyltransferase [Myxococcales bacterium]MCB9565470.1 GNAT family N-acetyltransferase [Kofleriaceae bacterium]MCB9573208.1 GNAT family N-acetyltransferase [Kofleriaceae bacterium]
MSVLVRRALPADGPAFLALVRALAAFESLPPPDDDAAARLVADAFADPPRYELWVAEVDGAVAAYAATFMTYSTFRARPTLFLEDLFVHPDARRRGVATAVLARLRAEAEARGCGRFEWMVLDWNADAQRLYAGVGAEEHSAWRLWRVTL